MKKLNNKGFAITTLLYGLLSVAFLIMTILMGVMSTNRQNTSNLVDRIEDELNRYGETETTFGYIGESQEYIVPYGEAGWYKIELWGAKTTSGNGDYTSGIIYLEENTILYFYLGKSCTNATTCASAFNQGNTEVRVEPTAPTQWNDTVSIRSTIMRAANGYGSNTTSFISGAAGMNAISSSGTPKYDPKHYSERVFINGLHIPDVHASDGMANVELISTNAKTAGPPKRTDKFDSVRYIRTCFAGNTDNTTNHLVEIQAIDFATGENLAKGKIINYSTSTASYATDGIINNSQFSRVGTGDQCTIVDLGGQKKLSEVAVWLYVSSGRSYLHHRVSISSDGTIYKQLKSYMGAYATSQVENELGYRYTPWQPDTTQVLTPGNYYIMPTDGSTNYTLTAQNARQMAAGEKANVTLAPFKGNKLQKWTVEPVDIYSTYIANKGIHTSKNVYKIYEAENLHALQNADGTAEHGENVNAAEKYRGYEWDLWEIIPLGNGTYKIKSLFGPELSKNSSTNNVELRNESVDNYNYNNRWKFINAEY